MYLPSALGLADRRTRFLFSFPVDAKGKGSEEWLNCFQSTRCQKVYATLGRIMFHRVRTAAGVLVGNFWKIQLQDLSSFLYANKRCSSMAPHGVFFLVLERFCSSSLEQPSSSLKPLSSSLLAGSLPRCVTFLVSTVLPCWSMVEGASSRIGSASLAVDRIVPLDESRDEVCRLKPVKRNECCCNGLIVKSSIFPTWPILLMSWATWLKETPRPSRPSRITAVKEQQR